MEDEAARRKNKVAHFEACKLAYRSLGDRAGVYSGVSEVKDTWNSWVGEGSTEKNLAIKEAGDSLMEGQEEDMEIDQKGGGVQVEKSINLPKLYKGSYEMHKSNLSCLIHKMDSIDPEAFKMFRLLNSVRHPAVVRHHTFYEENLVPRVVLSQVDIKLSDLLNTKGASERFFMPTNGRVSLKPELTTMIFDLCSGLEHLIKLELYPPKISIDDLYLCKDGPRRYRLQLLILEVEKLTTLMEKVNRELELWMQVKEIIKKIRKTACTYELNDVDERFVNYIGHGVSALAQYPLSWSYEQKGRYLLSIFSAKESDIRSKLKTSEQNGRRMASLMNAEDSVKKLKETVLDWPIDDKTGNSPKLIDILLKQDLERSRPSNYNINDPYDYVHMCRSSYKHHPEICKKVAEFKDTCPSREDLLQKMEKWQPLIWCILYEAIGLIGSL